MVNRQSMDFGIKENADVSLHDCRTRKIQLENSFLTFSIPDGFYFIKDSGAGESYNAEMRCHLSDLYPESFSVSGATFGTINAPGGGNARSSSISTK